MKSRHVNHLGINVEDLDAAKAFFVELGFSVQGEMEMKGDFVSRIVGLRDVRDNLVMLEAPDGQFSVELVQYHHPLDPDGVRPNQANSLGTATWRSKLKMLREL